MRNFTTVLNRFISLRHIPVLVLLGMLCQAPLFGQDIQICGEMADANPVCSIATPTPNVAIVLPSQTLGTPLSLVFKASGSLTGIQWSTSLGGGISPAGSGYSLSADGLPTMTLGGIALATGNYQFTIQVANASGHSDEQLFQITINRRPVDLMLVLDNSLSMNCCYNQSPPDPTCVSCGAAANSRLAKLKIAVDQFFTLGTIGTNPYFHTTNPDATLNDKFGAVIFSGSLDDSHSNYALNTPATLNAFIQAMGTSSGTAIGGGLLTAVNRMTAQSAVNRNKSLILFTDGEQNFNPMLKNIAAPVSYEAGPLPVHPYNPAAPNPPYGDCMPFPASTPVFDNNFRNTAPGIKISTIGFQLPPGPGNTLLASLSDKVNGAGGATFNTGMGATAFDFNTFFTNSFVELLSGSSPQIVKEQAGETQEGLNQLSFVLNDSVNTVTFMISGEGQTGRILQFRVKKDNQDVTSWGIMVNKASYNMWNLDFAARGNQALPGHIRPGGEWVLEITTKPGFKYQATCIVDDHQLNYNCSFGSVSAHSVGTPIPLLVSIKFKGKPVVDASEVVVLIEKTASDGGTALAQLPVPKDMKVIFNRKAVVGNDVVDPSYNNLGQMKHYALLQEDPRYAKALEGTVEKITLTNNGDGTYSGKYIPKVTGTQRFTFLIHGKNADIGEYHRVQVQSSVVRLSHFDVSIKNFKVEPVKDNGKLLGYRINLMIKDSSGLLLGPAFGNTFALTSSAGTFGPVTDNLDGSYSLTLNGIGSTSNPRIEISINGTKFYQGKVLGMIVSPIYLKWWFWLIVLIVAVVIYLIRRKKKNT